MGRSQFTFLKVTSGGVDPNGDFMAANGLDAQVVTPAKVLTDSQGHIIDISKTTYNDESLQTQYLGRFSEYVSQDFSVVSLFD